MTVACADVLQDAVGAELAQEVKEVCRVWRSVWPPDCMPPPPPPPLPLTIVSLVSFQAARWHGEGLGLPTPKVPDGIWWWQLPSADTPEAAILFASQELGIWMETEGACAWALHCLARWITGSDEGAADPAAVRSAALRTVDEAFEGVRWAGDRSKSESDAPIVSQLTTSIQRRVRAALRRAIELVVGS